MPDKLLKFDTFGLIRIDRDQVTVSITAVTIAGKSINRTITESVQEISEISTGEFASYSFGATLEAGNKSRIAIKEITAPASGASVEGLSQVRTVIEHALDFIRKRL